MATILGDKFNNVLVGDGGGQVANDIIIGRGGDDILNGLGGDDELFGEENATFPLPSDHQPGNDTLNGGTGNDKLHGQAGDDVLNGDEGNDTLSGGEGNDRLDGGSGNDSMNGGFDDDVYIVDSAGDTVTDVRDQVSSISTRSFGDPGDIIDPPIDDDFEFKLGGQDRVESSVSFNLSNAAFVEDLKLTGTADINGTGSNDANVIVGNSGNNVLSGLVGNDTISGAGGNDTLNGGAGSDILNGDGGDDNMNGGAGVDTLNSGKGNDRLDGGGADNAKDTLRGESGDDTYVISNDTVPDLIFEIVGQGIDTVESEKAFTLPGFSPFEGVNELENLTLKGNSAINGTGNQLNNVITGNGADNLLSGAAGNDTLNGGAGKDRYSGGTGDDTLVFDSADLVAAGANQYAGGAFGQDTIRLDSGSQGLNLGFVPDSVTNTFDVISSVEVIDLNKAGAAGLNVLEFAKSDVFAINETHTLRVDGDASDQVSSQFQGWQRGADQTIGGELYRTYNDSTNQVHLLVDDSIQQTIT